MSTQPAPRIPFFRLDDHDENPLHFRVDTLEQSTTTLIILPAFPRCPNLPGALRPRSRDFLFPGAFHCPR